MTAPTGHVVMWTCLCSDAADHPTWLAETCPGHGRRRICDPIPNELPGAVAPGHRCGEAKCMTERSAR